jgi:hypothetical protein
MGCAIAAELSGLVSEFGLVVLVLRAVRTVTVLCLRALKRSFVSRDPQPVTHAHPPTAQSRTPAVLCLKPTPTLDHGGHQNMVIG